MSDSAIADVSALSAAPSSREGRLADLDLYDWRDLKLLGMAIRDGWVSGIAELREWQSKLTGVRETTSDEKAIIAATAVQATVVKTLADSYTKALKAAEGESASVNNTQINNTIDLSGLTVEQLRALAGGEE